MIIKSNNSFSQDKKIKLAIISAYCSQYSIYFYGQLKKRKEKRKR